MKMYESFIRHMQEQGLGHLLMYDYEEARKSRKRYVIVLIPKEPTGWFDLYLTMKVDGLFSEVGAWKAREIQNYPAFLDVAFQYILETQVPEDENNC